MKIRFEGLTNGTEISPIPDGYAGMEWDNVGAVDKDHYPDTGYQHVVNSEEYVAYTYGSWSRMQSDTDFDPDRGYFEAAWSDNLKVTFRGYDDGVKTARLTMHFDKDQASKPTGEQLAFDDLNVTFEAAASADAFVA